MVFLKRLKYVVRLWIARRPTIFFVSYFFVTYRKLLVGKNIGLVIEGFPRSGNTFSVIAFQSVQNDKINIAHHLHAQAQVLRAVELNLPVCVLIRQPIDAIASLLVREPYLQLATTLEGYVEFYSDIIAVSDKLLIVTFDEVITDFGKVTERINKKFDKQYQCFEHTPNNVEEIFKIINEINQKVDAGHDAKIAMPTEQKTALKNEVFYSDHDLLLLEQANKIYNLLSESRE